MNRKEFLSRLEQALQEMPAEECRRAVEYYENYFDEAGPEKEQEVLEQLGTPEKVAEDILRDYRESSQGDNQQSASERKRPTFQQMKTSFQSLNTTQKALTLLLLVVAACVIVPIGIGIIGGIGGFLIAVIGTICMVFLLVPALAVAAWAAMVGLLIAGGFVVSANPIAGLLLFGLALICAACGILLVQLTKYLFGSVFPDVIRKIVSFIRNIGHHH